MMTSASITASILHLFSKNNFLPDIEVESRGLEIEEAASEFRDDLLRYVRGTYCRAECNSFTS